MKKIFYGWWVVFSCGIISLWGGGLFYGISCYVKPIAEDFGWTYLSVSLAFSLRSVELGLLAPLTGFLTDRLGPKKVIGCSTLVTGAGFVLLGQVNSLITFYLAFVILSIGLSGYSQVVVTTAVAYWFGKKIGRTTGIATAGYGLGGILMPLIVWLISSWGWRTSLSLLGIGTAFVILPASLLLRHRPEQYGLFPDGENPVTSGNPGMEDALGLSADDFTTAGALKTKTFWLLGLVFGIQLMVFSAVTLHVMPYFASVGVLEESAAVAAMFILLSGVTGRLAFGWLADLFDKRRLLSAALFSQAVGLVFFCCGHTPWHMIAFISLYGPASGALVVLRPAMLRHYFGRRAFGSIQGVITAVMTVGAIIGPAYAGWVYDVQKDYLGAWISLLIALLVAIPVTFGVRRGHKVGV